MLRRIIFPIILTALVLLPAGYVWRASSRPDPIRIETLVSEPIPATSTTDPCGPACELDAWQRAVWDVAVWENAVAENAVQAQRERHEHAPSVSGTGCPAEIVEVIHAAFAGTGAEDWAVGIAWRESRCQPGATNPNGCCVDSGLFQLRMPIHAHRVAGCDVFDPACNARAARSLFDECGRGPWTKPYWC